MSDEWTCTREVDGKVCGKKASVKSTCAGVVSYTCDYCDPPDCEVCNSKGSAVGWMYSQFKSSHGSWKKTYMCTKCLPVRRSARFFGNPYAHIRGWTPAVQPGGPRSWNT